MNIWLNKSAFLNKCSSFLLSVKIYAIEISLHKKFPNIVPFVIKGQQRVWNRLFVIEAHLHDLLHCFTLKYVLVVFNSIIREKHRKSLKVWSNEMKTIGFCKQMFGLLIHCLQITDTTYWPFECHRNAENTCSNVTLVFDVLEIVELCRMLK